MIERKHNGQAILSDGLPWDLELCYGLLVKFQPPSKHKHLPNANTFATIHHNTKSPEEGNPVITR